MSYLNLQSELRICILPGCKDDPGGHSHLQYICCCCRVIKCATCPTISAYGSNKNNQFQNKLYHCNLSECLHDRYNVTKNWWHTALPRSTHLLTSNCSFYRQFAPSSTSFAKFLLNNTSFSIVIQRQLSIGASVCTATLFAFCFNIPEGLN